MRAAIALVVSLACAAAGTAHAQQIATTVSAPVASSAPVIAAPSLRFRVAAWPDGVIEGATLSAVIVPLIWPNSFPHATCAPCDASRLWAMDRGTVGPVRAAANTFSSVTLGAEAAMGVIFVASSRRGEGSGAFYEDAAVLTQAVSVTAAATMALKILFHRPRPLMYLPGGTFTADDGRGFPSSHTSLAFAAAAAYASMLHRRGIAGSHKLDIGALFASAVATGILRVVAREHVPTDVAAGAALGFAIGWTIPALHSTRP